MLNELEATPKPSIHSSLVHFSDPRSLQIVAYLDEGPEEDWNERVVVLAPRYGETKKNNLQLAYTLAANGFKVLRFDQTNHIGESDGEMHLFTLSGAATDIATAVEYVESFCEPAEIILVSLSLSCRCAMRAATQSSRISRMVNVVGMIDMDATLRSIYRRDFFGELTDGADWRIVDILGFEIDGKHFHDDLLTHDMKVLEGTISDAAKINIPVLHLYAENDRWVRQEDVERVIATCPKAELVKISDVGHEINENPKAVAFAFSKIVEYCLKGLPLTDGGPRMPDKRELVQQNREERKRLQQILKLTDTESEFWGDYLGKFGIIEEAHYYAEYFQSVASSLGAIQPHDVILDAGCGNGFYGISLLKSIQLQARSGGIKHGPFHYCGIDLTADGLMRSYLRQSDARISEEMAALGRSMDVGFSYRKIDFDVLDMKGAKLPFEDGSIGKICCSLVLSYLKTPLNLVKEFHRILKPGGVAVVSSMKPGCDMTVLFHEYVDKDTPDRDHGDDANRLLSAAGKIKLKRDSGVYQFFDEEELLDLGIQAGFKQLSVSRSLGDQANVIRLAK